MNYGSILKISAIFFCINSVAVGQFSQFHIGIYTEDFYQPIRLNPASCNYALINNSNFVGHDPTYIRSLSPDYITLIVPWSEHFKPIRKLYSNVPGRHYLDDCLFWGIKVALTTPDFHYDNGLNPIVDVAEIGNAYTYYYHPAIDAIHISDETGYENFSILNTLHNQLSILGARSFSNLLPLYASTKQLQYGKNYAGNDGLTATPSNYRYYIERFLASNPKNLAFDYYVEFDFLSSNPTRYWMNLSLISKYSRQSNLPFYHIITTQGYQFANSNFFPPTGSCEIESIPGEVLFKIFSGLVYGSKSILYWTRETRYGSNFLGFNLWDDINSDIKDLMKRTHSKLLENKELIFNLKRFNVYHYSKSSVTSAISAYDDEIETGEEWLNVYSDERYSSHFKDTEVYSEDVDGIRSLLISFCEDEIGNKYLWVMNKSIWEENTFVLPLKSNKMMFDLFQKQFNLTGSVNLQAGEGKLFRLSDRNVNNVNICGSNPSTILTSGNVIIGCSSESLLSNTSVTGNGVKISNTIITSNVRISHANSAQHLRSMNEKPDLELKTIKVYPNPATEFFHLKVEQMEISDLRIYSISGSEVLNFNFERINPKHIIINVADFKPGIYLVLVNLVGGDSMNYKIAVIK